LAILHGNEGSASDCHPTEKRGTFLGAGGQYTAYDAGEGRVLKWPNSLEEATRILSDVTEKDPQEHAYMVVHFRDESVPHVLRLATRYPELSSAVGHPIPLPESTFTQNSLPYTFFVVKKEDVKGNGNVLDFVEEEIAQT